MVDTVMTLGKQTVYSRIRGAEAVPPSGDFREIPFQCRFSADAVNGGPPPAPPPEIRVTVTGRIDQSALVVEIIPPRGSTERLEARRGTGSVPWARPLVVEEGRVLLPSTRSESAPSATPLSWVYEDPFDDFRPEWVDDTPPPIDPRPPGGGGGASGQRFSRILDPRVDPIGSWRVRVRNRGGPDADLLIRVDYPETVQLLRETRIPFQLLNRAFAEAMLALGLGLKIDNGRARLSFDRGFKALTRLSDQVFSVNERIKDVNLVEYTIRIGNEAGVPVILAGFDLEDRGSEIGVPFAPDVDFENLAVSLRVVLGYSYPRYLDFFQTAMQRENDRINQEAMDLIPILEASPYLVGFWRPWADVILGVGGCLGLSQSSVEEYIQEAIDAAESKLIVSLSEASRYFYDVIMHLAERGDIMHHLSADDDALIVQHHRRPERPGLRDFLDVIMEIGGSDSDAVTAGTNPEGTGPSTTEESPRQTPALGTAATNPGSARARSADESPRRTRVSARTTAGRPGIREGSIDHIVVLMLENRSFDHMLGYRGLATTDVNGLSGNESNRLTDDNAPYPVFHNPITSGIPTPAHGFDETREQIADGAMSGFVKNYDKLASVVDPNLVMSYYTGRELPMYDFLANNYAICDNWHSSHPGETQCNRFCSFTGRTPELDNFDVADPRLAYFDGSTVFELLTELDVDWAYAEGNVAFLRVFDRYRIDVRHVIPFRDDFSQGISDTFEARVTEGRLPSVTFVDPRYITVPPEWAANDDFPPGDVCRGQDLVRGVYGLLSSEEATWAHTLLVITYDEHGGFYDHSPPRGTALSDNPSPLPRVHPNGADHLGVRVPAFLVTPWIDAGKVVHTLFDHTSILKTILERFAPADFPIEDVFGERTARANGLFSELRASARTDRPGAPDFPACTSPVGNRGSTVGLERREFQTAMRLLGVPARYRDRAGRPA
jgi:phospholipase C